MIAKKAKVSYLKKRSEAGEKEDKRERKERKDREGRRAFIWRRTGMEIEKGMRLGMRMKSKGGRRERRQREQSEGLIMDWRPSNILSSPAHPPFISGRQMKSGPENKKALFPRLLNPLGGWGNCSCGDYLLRCPFFI